MCSVEHCCSNFGASFSNSDPSVCTCHNIGKRERPPVDQRKVRSVPNTPWYCENHVSTTCETCSSISIAKEEISTRFVTDVILLFDDLSFLAAFLIPIWIWLRPTSSLRKISNSILVKGRSDNRRSRFLLMWFLVQHSWWSLFTRIFTRWRRRYELCSCFSLSSSPHLFDVHELLTTEKLVSIYETENLGKTADFCSSRCLCHMWVHITD